MAEMSESVEVLVRVEALLPGQKWGTGIELGIETLQIPLVLTDEVHGQWRQARRERGLAYATIFVQPDLPAMFQRAGALLSKVGRDLTARGDEMHGHEVTWKAEQLDTDREAALQEDKRRAERARRAAGAT